MGREREPFQWIVSQDNRSFAIESVLTVLIKLTFHEIVAVVVVFLHLVSTVILLAIIVIVTIGSVFVVGRENWQDLVI